MTSRFHIEALVQGSGPRTRVMRATRVPSGEQVLLKEGSLGQEPHVELALLRREFSIASPIRSPGVARYVGVENNQGRVALVVEGFGDASLAQLLALAPLPLESGLRIGVQLAEGLADIHGHEVVHRAIHPGNVLVDSKTLQAKIVDFSAASLLEDVPDPSQGDAQAIPLAYISPEQSGRMNRGLDYRTDFYSLGATLYHMFSGQPPFALTDPLSLVHAHIASAHRPLRKLNPEIPDVLSKIVDKLLAKNAEERYQSARGVAADLSRCLEQLTSSGTIASFPLGEHDVPDRFVVPQRLYGRNAERSALLQAFHAAAMGEKLLLVVGGPSGIGKSALVNEVHKPILERRGTFVAGKFDPLHQHAPYSALAHALSQLCRPLLTLSEQELAEWRTRILERISVNAGLIIALAPELAQIIGPQPQVPETGPLEAQHRFDLTLGRFLGAFASPEHPLVIFLDDLQRADPATLHALSAVLRLPEPRHLLVMGAYRDNEVGESHVLTRTLAEVRAAGVSTRSVQLTGLQFGDVLSLLSDTLHKPSAVVNTLSQVVLKKTDGNPFFVHQFLRALRDEKYLYFDRGRGEWTWDVKRIEALDITDNVVDLMLRKLERLPKATQRCLQMGACVGTTFDIELLAKVAERTPTDMRAQLAPAIRDGLLVPLDPQYPLGLVDVSSDPPDDEPNYWQRFLHDRVHQAAYESVPEPEREVLHLRIGRIMAAASDPRHSFETVDQLNRGAAMMHDPREREAVCAMNLQAGKRALASTAYSEAFAYLERGLSQLPEHERSHPTELGRDLHLAYVESAYRSGRLEDAERSAKELLPKLHTDLERVRLYELRIVIETQHGNHTRAIELGREALRALGHPVPKLDSVAPLLAMRARVALAMRGKAIEDLPKMPELSDLRLVAVTRILNKLYSTSYMANPKLFYWLVLDTLLIALKHGVNAPMISGILCYGMVLIAQERDYAQGLACGKFAMARADQSEAFPYRGNLYCAFACCHLPHSGDLRDALPIARRAVDAATESGDLMTASFALTVATDIMFMSGFTLTEVLAEAERNERAVQSFRGTEMMHTIRVVKQLVRCLRGETQPPGSFSSPELPESTLAAELAGVSTAAAVRAFYALRRIVASTIVGDYDTAVRMVVSFDREISTGNAGTYAVMHYDYYACIALIASLRKTSRGGRTHRALLRKKAKLIAAWATSAAPTFGHRHTLLCAELNDLKGRHAEASRLYDQALAAAEERGLHHDAALIAELAGRAAQRQGHTRLARIYLSEARTNYEQWGALAKVHTFDKEHPELVDSVPSRQPKLLSLDVASIVRTSQALSQEISLPSLLERIMRVIVQVSGAQRGSLLRVLAPDASRELQLEAHLDNEHSAVLVPTDPQDPGHGFASEAIVRYTLRTGEDVVLTNASEHGPFTADPYVAARGSKSVLSLALRQRDRVVGILFLENELSIGAFTEERLEVLRLLLAQAAISLENARLVESLRTKEALLRDFLEGIPIGVYVTDAEGRPTYANKKALEIGGQGFKDSTAENASVIHQVYVRGTDQIYPIDRSPLTRALRGESTMADDVELRRGEKRVPLGVWGTPIRGEDGAVRHAIITFQDLSAQHALQAERERLESQLQQGARLESIGRLAGGVAHDFNNLLTPMLVYSELAARDLPEQSAARKQIEQVHEAAERGAELTRQLLTFGRQQAIAPHEIDINQELSTFQRMFRRLVREDVKVELRLGANLGKVCADPSSLQRIFMNLGMNAVDAMQSGGCLLFQTASVTLPARANEDSRGPFGACVALRVSDNGLGMDKATIDRVFDPFFTTKAPGKGTGLGLPTVYGLVEQHGGRLSVSSQPGKGSCFEIILPCAQEGRPSAKNTESPPEAQQSGRGETVLVVEDDAVVRGVLREILSSGGFHVIDTADPRDAVRLALNLGERLDLLVSDVVMPNMNGRELAALISRSHPGLPVLFVSGYSESVLSQADLSRGRFELLQKPITAETLEAKVLSMLAARRASTGAPE